MIDVEGQYVLVNVLDHDEVLLALELVLPGFVLIWFGLAAIVVGVVALVVDWSVQTLALIWAAASIAFLLAGRRFFLKDAGRSPEPLLNDRAGRLVGRVYTLSEPLGENGGTLRIDDGVWRITGPLLPAGAKVVVQGVEGTVLVVRPAE